MLVACQASMYDTYSSKPELKTYVYAFGQSAVLSP